MMALNERVLTAEFADGVLRSTQQAMDRSQPSCAPDLDRHHKQELAETMLRCTLKNLQRGSSVWGKVKAFRLAHEKLPRTFELLVAFPALGATFEQLTDLCSLTLGTLASV